MYVPTHEMILLLQIVRATNLKGCQSSHPLQVVICSATAWRDYDTGPPTVMNACLCTVSRQTSLKHHHHQVQSTWREGSCYVIVHEQTKEKKQNNSRSYHNPELSNFELHSKVHKVFEVSIIVCMVGYCHCVYDNSSCAGSKCLVMCIHTALGP